AAEVRKATLTIQLTERGKRPLKQQIENDIRHALQQLPGVRTKVGLGGSGEKYVLVLTGEDPQALQTAAMAVENDLRTINGLGSIASTASLVRPEIAVRPDFAKAADLGVTSAAISDTLRVATLGDYDAALPKLNLSQRQVPIVVKLENDARKELGLLERLNVPGSRGPVMLGQIATIELASGPAVIDRYDRQRNVNFEIGTDVNNAAIEVQNRVRIAEPSLPDAVKRLGLVVRKRNPSIMVALAFYSPNGTHDINFIGNYANIYVKDALQRVKGVGDIVSRADEFGMRIWLNPEKLASLGMSSNEVLSALTEQNLQVAAGTVGGNPQPNAQAFEYSVLTNI
ncbi:MAG: hypothetical protein EBU92_15265, partial [Betaproteobacteria bacterium]|nr:hypothetical protein [Betaproteobacteria bacterium]